MAASGAKPVWVSIRLDTEDFVTPASNDALLFLARALTRLGIRATFPLVAEKLRFLYDLGCQEALRALREHDVGYHSASHSRHPTIAEELRDLGWDEGVAAFAARERPGLEKVADFCGHPPVCYTQPGANWVPQASPVLRRCGIAFQYSEAWNAYVDFDGKPFVYGGVLHWSAPVPAPKPFFTHLPGNLAEARRLFDRAYAALQAGKGGWVNLVAHPTELVSLEYWDVVNFGGGRNPPPGAPLRPPRQKSRSQLARAQRALLAYLEYVRSRPGVEFVSAGAWSGLFPDRCRGRMITASELAAAAVQAAEPPSYAVVGDRAYSPAELFGMLVEALAAWAETGELPAKVPWRYLDGPAAEPAPSPRARPVPVEPALVPQAARSVHEALKSTGRLPDEVTLSPALTVSPAAYLSLAARCYLRLWEARAPADHAATDRRGTAGGATDRAAALELSRVDLEPATFRYVKPVERLHWDWPVFAPGFRAPRLHQLARLAAWTLKPALPAVPLPPAGGGVSAPAGARPGGRDGSAGPCSRA